FPLFSDEERKVVGTAYKQESREKAIKWGLQYFGPKLLPMVEAAEKLAAEKNHPKTLLVHCWRGGMRSAAVAWLLDLYGFRIFLLKGGYKAYRQWVLQTLAQPFPLHLVGGYTGSGKTELLQALKAKGAAVLDLEALAAHKGSAFGKLGMPPTPSQEFFENQLAQELVALQEKLPALSWPVVFVEDESQRIGEINIPAPFYQQMRQAPMVFLDIPFAARLEHILAGYGKFETEKLLNAIVRIQKRLGGLETKNAVQCLLEKDLQGCFSILLTYYDKYYLMGKNKRPNPDQQVQHLSLPAVNPTTNARQLLQAIGENPGRPKHP
ncbi:MAG: tRNA 2-selenouridine(34) synthase MnmH, partial [Sphingobacteriia bacterium]